MSIKIHILTSVEYPQAVFQFNLDTNSASIKFKRVTILQLATAIGGLMFGLIGLFKLINQPFSYFSMNRLILRKLYHVKKSEHPSYEQKTFPESEFVAPGHFYDHMNKFTSFNYSGKSWLKSSMCHCYFCCCRKCRDSVADRNFYKAQDRLYKEIDLI